MARNLPPLNPLRAFESAGRLGSFTNAARELNVSHSAISRHIRGLEKRLNVHLFRNQNTGVALTEQGQSYLARITPALDQISSATDALTATPAGVVTLTTENTLGQKWLVPRLVNLRARHPEIDLRLSITAEVMDIEAHDYDLGLRYLRTDPLNASVQMFPSQVRAYAAPDFAMMAGTNVDLTALASGPLIEEATFRFWPEWFRKSGLPAPGNIHLPHPMNALLAIEAAVSGLGAVLMDKHLCEPEVKSGALVCLGDAEILYGGYYMAVNTRAARRKSVRAVQQWLQDECRAILASDRLR